MLRTQELRTNSHEQSAPDVPPSLPYSLRLGECLRLPSLPSLICLSAFFLRLLCLASAPSYVCGPRYVRGSSHVALKQTISTSRTCSSPSSRSDWSYDHTFMRFWAPRRTSPGFRHRWPALPMQRWRLTGHKGLGVNGSVDGESHCANTYDASGKTIATEASAIGRMLQCC